jgi:hypothetical protein
LIPVTAKERISRAKAQISMARSGKSPSDPKEVKRKRLSAAFGVDFEEPGKRNLDVVRYFL